MTDYTKLVVALRVEPFEVESEGLAKVMNDAADAIEALQYEIRESMQKCAECGANEPKRGEWVEENRRPRSSQFVCSECHRTAYDPQPTRDKAWKKRCRYAYCPNCGAKMEVQDADTD